MARIELLGVKKSYGDTSVLSEINLDIADGEYVVLLGPSGCGKSTLLRCIAGLEEISTGELRIAGRRANELSPRDRDLAMVFQGYALYPHMTVRENISFALKIRGVPATTISKQVDEVAEMLGLGGVLDRLPGQLSGGQRQRVAMGRAIVRNPAAFLFDEPLSNLDTALRAHMRVELKRLHRRLGVTTVHVTHDQVEAMTLADRLVVLHAGCVQQVGTPADVYHRPENRFVASFLGTPSMNLWPGQGHGATTELGGLSWPIPGQGPCTVGIRPSDVVLGEGPMEARIDLVEPLGDEAVVHLAVGTLMLVARSTQKRTFEAGSMMRFGWETVHRFDATSGKRLC